MLQVVVLLLVVILVSTSKAQYFDKDMEPKPHLLYEPNAPDYTSAVPSLFDKLAVDPQLSTFMDVLTQVGSVMQLVNNSELQQPITIFCPVNAAFNHRTTDVARLDDFLRRHVVPSADLEPSDLKHSQTLDAMEGTIRVDYHLFSRKTTLNDIATVDTGHAIHATNGIAYKVDHTLSAKP
ncbi:hypothetical protein BCR43DRAFT_485759 [Syncephalastrum racemosum]|uniref:FAS1 domain-containing protein n=1 Tax=Syncephalastrum racemosum TaxID=13706 RepID=A0A1X2HN15_SYNRA|nr:hypothetical protein BCR43DRAFT_485759 [Syncephalastrum racemosum]